MSIGRICRREVHLVDPSDTVQEAAHRMKVRAVGTLVAVDSKRHPVGVITDRDIVTRVVAPGLDGRQALVAEAMTRNPVSVLEDTSIEDALRSMLAHSVRRLLVVDRRGALAGIVSMDDALQLLGDELHTLGRLIGRQPPARAWA